MRPDIEVVNTGLHGLRAVHHLATMKETLGLEPDMYLFMLGANDWMKQFLDEYKSLTDRIQEYSLDRTLLGLALDQSYTWMLHPTAARRPHRRQRMAMGRTHRRKRARSASTRTC